MDFSPGVCGIMFMVDSNIKQYATHSKVINSADQPHINRVTTFEFNHIRATRPTIKPYRIVTIGPEYSASTLDDVFKVGYVEFIYNSLCKLEPDWEKRVINIFNLWEDIGTFIDQERFATVFHSESLDLELPSAIYSLENAYHAANCEWRIELILATVDVLLKNGNHSIDRETDIVFWDMAKQQMVVDCSICWHFGDVAKSVSLKRTASCDHKPQAKKQCTGVLDDMRVDYTVCKDRDTAGMKRPSSADDNVPSAKKQRVVVKAFNEKDEFLKHPSSMENIFKFDYMLSVFSVLGQVEPDWRKQVNNIINIWDHGVQLINRELLQCLFVNECRELRLPVETFDFERAYNLAATEWRIELMLAVVEQIIKWFDDDVSLHATELAVWDIAKQEIIIDRSVCKKC